MTTTEIKNMVNARRKYGYHPASDAALAVLLLLETDEFDNSYQRSVNAALDTYPGARKFEIEKELDRYI